MFNPVSGTCSWATLSVSSCMDCFCLARELAAAMRFFSDRDSGFRRLPQSSPSWVASESLPSSDRFNGPAGSSVGMPGSFGWLNSDVINVCSGNVDGAHCGDDVGCAVSGGVERDECRDLELASDRCPSVSRPSSEPDRLSRNVATPGDSVASDSHESSHSC